MLVEMGYNEQPALETSILATIFNSIKMNSTNKPSAEQMDLNNSFTQHLYLGVGLFIQYL